MNSQSQSIYQATYTYDNAGHLLSEQDPNSLYSYSYDDSGDMTQDVVTYPGVSGSPLVTLSYSFDSRGNRTSLSDSLGGSISYSYNGRSQLTSESFALNGTAGPAISFTYDNQDQLSGTVRTDGLGDFITSSYSYDNVGNLTNLEYTDLTKNTILANYTYGYDSSGDVTSYQDASSSLTYGYDNSGQLTSVTGTLNGSSYSASYSYDANGNRNMPGYQIGTGNELLNDGTYTYTYDKNDNTLTKTNTATGDEWFYTWDYHNRLTEAVEKTSSGTVENDEKYTYDVEGRLIGVNVNGTQQSWTVFDGANAYMDFNGAGMSVTDRYVTNPMAYGTLYARVSGSGTSDWYVTDKFGSVRLIVDPSGNVLDAIVYDSWGNIVSESSPSNGDRFKFAGGQYDSIQQTYLFTTRWYNPEDSRWESQDPLGLSPDTNPYRYVGNSPIENVDPSGMAQRYGFGLVETFFRASGRFIHIVKPGLLELYDKIWVAPTYNSFCGVPWNTKGTATAVISVYFWAAGEGEMIEPGEYHIYLMLQSTVAVGAVIDEAEVTWKWGNGGRGSEILQKVTSLAPPLTDNTIADVGFTLKKGTETDQVATGTLFAVAPPAYGVASWAMAETTVSVVKMVFENASTGHKWHTYIF